MPSLLTASHLSHPSSSGSASWTDRVPFGNERIRREEDDIRSDPSAVGHHIEKNRITGSTRRMVKRKREQRIPPGQRFIAHRDTTTQRQRRWIVMIRERTKEALLSAGRKMRSRIFCPLLCPDIDQFVFPAVRRVREEMRNHIRGRSQ